MPRAKDRILVAEQSVYGTAETANFLSLHLAGEPTKDDITADFKSNRVSLDTGEAQFFKGRYHYALTLPVELEASQLPFFLKNLLGEYAFSADDPVAGANTHTFKLSDTAAELAQLANLGFTLEMGGDGKFFTYDSCIITSFEMGELEQGVIPVTLNILARDEVEAATTAGVFSADDNAQVLNTLQTVVSAGVDASEVAQPVRMTSLTITRTNVAPMFIMSSNNVVEWNLGDLTEIFGTFEIQVSDTERVAVLDDFKNSDELSVTIASTSGEFVTGSTAFSLTFDMSECKYTGRSTSSDGHNRYEKYEFRAGKGGNADVITVTAVNAEATLA